LTNSYLQVNVDIQTIVYNFKNQAVPLLIILVQIFEIEFLRGHKGGGALANLLS
jgi:hypothetical protein